MHHPRVGELTPRSPEYSDRDPLDPYGIAHLRSGVQELLKLHLFELVQKGNLAVAEEKHWYGTKRWLVAVADTPDRHYLSPLEQSLLAPEWPHDPYVPAECLLHLLLDDRRQPLAGLGSNSADALGPPDDEIH